MLPHLQASFDALARESDAVQQRARALSAEQLTRVAAPGEWSALQIVGHLMLSSETVGTPRGDGAAAGKPLGGLFHRLVIAALNLNARLPMPDEAINPETALGADVSLDEVLKRWDTAREEMRVYLESVTPLTAERRPFLHAVIGPLTSGQVLELGTAHTSYHRRQLERLVRAL